jgi:(1->4)-alpha-D-glucan 1-alpha-D-glucosylmutase
VVRGVVLEGGGLRVPRSTYRLQFNRDFTFADAARVVPYLAELGVGDLYASPYMNARAGSTHGYDIIDHNALNPEIGSGKDYERMVEALRERGMGQLLDLVPNHMGIGSDNSWWLDVLENGPASPYARYFDIDWYPANRRQLWGKVLLPILGDHYRAVLEGGELELGFDAEEGSFSVSYYEHRCPLDPKTYPMVLADLPRDERMLELQSLADAFGNLPGRDETDEEAVEARNRDAAIYRGWFSRLCAESPEVRRVVEERVERVNGDPDDPESFEALHRILEEQAYRLAYWRVASDEINYRRFFSINDLAGIRTEDEEVFEATHRLVLDLLRRGEVTGLRIDHPDGLYDPAGYFRRLQEAAAEALGTSGSPAVYVLAEKILAHHEGLPEDWPISGTTGYEFTNLVNGVFVNAAGEAGMDRAYRRFLGRSLDFEEILYSSKRFIMRSALASELNVLSRRLLRISEYGRRSFDFTINVLRDALSEIVAAFPVYRTYITAAGVSESDRRYVDWAAARAKKRSTAADTSAFDFIRDVLLLESGGPEEYRGMVVHFVMKFQQYTGPMMAKGMEDTALYIYNRLISLNEVGGEPERFGVSVSAFHHLNGERMRRWPNSMLSTSTHDTKRSEDVRARVNVLSEIPNQWRGQLIRWARTNRSRRRETDGGVAPSRNDEYLLYQTLVGAWPLGELDERGLAELRERILAYMEKAIREAQVHTSWINVNEEYEVAIVGFVEALLSPAENNLFLEEFAPFARRVSRLGALNSLSQTLLKLTAPGVPDIYQGNELWDFSLVDPDNRRPVDYSLREKLLAGLKALDEGSLAAGARSLLDGWEDGRPKLHLTRRALALRNERPELFERGEYVPLEAEGERADHLVAFARRLGEEAAISVSPRLYASLTDDSGPLLPDPETWAGTRIEVPELPGADYRNVLTGEVVRAEERNGRLLLPATDLLKSFPVALLVAERTCRSRTTNIASNSATLSP